MQQQTIQNLRNLFNDEQNPENEFRDDQQGNEVPAQISLINPPSAQEPPEAHNVLDEATQKKYVQLVMNFANESPENAALVDALLDQLEQETALIESLTKSE